MGDTRRLAERVNLLPMRPDLKLASTGYCLADPGKEYVVYQPKADASFTVKLKPGTYAYEWFDITKGAVAGKGRREFTGSENLKAPFPGPAALYLLYEEP